MSTSELPTPIRNIAANADTSLGEAAINTSGADHNTTPTPKSLASR